MTRQQLFGIVLGTSLGLALASPAPAQIIKDKVITKPTPPVPGAFSLSVVKIEFSGQGNTWDVTGGQFAPVARPGAYEVRVLVKNTGPSSSPKGAKKCEIQVKGGKQVGTYGWSYDKKFTDDTPPLAPNEQKYCYVKLAPDVTDTGNYHAYANLKP